MSLSSADMQARAASELGGEHTSLQQKDNLCGPFHVARLLRDAGITEWEGQPLDQDLVALRAGTLLPARTTGPQVPPDALSWSDYRYELALAEPEDAGTQPGDLAHAMHELSQERLACVPLSGRWDGEVVQRVVARGRAAGARLLANVRTGRLWGSRPPLHVLLALLDGHEPPEPPAADWDVGHYVELLQLVCGAAGGLVVVRDSYPSLGWSGHHLQPPATLAAALMRGDGREGGMLAAVAPSDAAAVQAIAAELGLEVRLWNN